MITLNQLHAAINRVRPDNGFIRGPFIMSGWTAQPNYKHRRK